MNARQFLDFFETKTGAMLLFGFLVAFALALYAGYRSQQKLAPPLVQPVIQDAPSKPRTVNRSFQEMETITQRKEKPAVAKASPASVQLPISVYQSAPSKPVVTQNYAPYGRLIPCETIITIDSSRITTPIIGLVTEDVWHDGRLIIPAAAEIHGRAQVDRSRERIASEEEWMMVWRSSDRLNGAELPIKGIALDMEKEMTGQGWALTDGSAGLRGQVIRTDNLAEIKLFASTFLGAVASGFQDTETITSPLTGEFKRTALDSPKNAALQGVSAVINEYARQMSESIRRDGFYIRVPAGKQFYLYVTQTLDLQHARKGQSQPKK